MNDERSRYRALVAYTLVVLASAIVVSVATSDYRRSAELSNLRVQVLCEAIEANRADIRDAAATLARPSGGLTAGQQNELEQLLRRQRVASATCTRVEAQARATTAVGWWRP